MGYLFLKGKKDMLARPVIFRRAVIKIDVNLKLVYLGLSKEEFDDVLKSMKDDKAPGEDGFLLRC